jgi:hypothetical protein
VKFAFHYGIGQGGFSDTTAACPQRTGSRYIDGVISRPFLSIHTSIDTQPIFVQYAYIKYMAFCINLPHNIPTKLQVDKLAVGLAN